MGGKRSAEEDNDAVFSILAAQEPAQCYRRLICDLSAGAIPDNNKITTLFNGEVSPVSAKFEFATAAKVGKIVKSAQLCEVRYSCPLSSQEIQNCSTRSLKKLLPKIWQCIHPPMRQIPLMLKTSRV